MKLTDWAALQGINYLTAYRWFKAGHLKNARQMPTGTILVDSENISENKAESCYIYCRVSNQSRKKEMEYQVSRCEIFCSNAGLSVKKVFKEVASGMNDSRKQLSILLDLPDPKVIVV